MDPILYEAAAAGDIDPFENHQTCLDQLLTPDESTILHVYLRKREPRSTDFVDMVLERCPALLLQATKKGETPLHLAAKYGHSNVVKVLIDRAKAPPADLESGVTAMLRMTNGEGDTALHEAARNAIQGRVNVMKEIISRCPACCDLVDNRGWNALHYVVVSQSWQAFKECLSIPELERLKTEKDDKGNTPFHLVAAITHKRKRWNEVYPYEECGIYGLNKQELSIEHIHVGDFVEIQKEIIESLEDVGSTPFGNVPYVSLHKGYKIEEDIKKSENNYERKEKEEEALNKARESHLVVAALIATVTFAAAFTLPGGYKSDQGTAILAKKAAFIVFVISDAISMVLSTSAVFIHFLLAFLQGLFDGMCITNDTTEKLFGLATFFTIIGMGSMIIAFITGTFAVLQPVLGLAISVCLIGLSFFLLACLVSWIIRKDYRRITKFNEDYID